MQLYNINEASIGIYIYQYISINLNLPLNYYLIVSLISIILYGSLALSSIYYYYKLKKSNKEGKKGVYDESKLLFFACLGISSFLDVPSYVFCLIYGGPVECEWVGYSLYLFFN